ncbi:trimeric intracellular cation channel family protein [Flaviflexus massiliensis]|uniref:trimeric intracellular cation channel family protein n=1 Tax=Flaviflexus massiliensis TaxID=1522309 RepID=UPI00097D1C86|nr:trimeric intracellular cation channel family protein [Flaviflexus massiliensis]
MLLTVLFIIGITAEAMTGALAAGRQKMDLFGVIMVANVTALGGGSVRDMLLGHYPLTWVENPHYLIIVSVAALITVFTSSLMKYFRVLFLVLDSVGLAVFTVFGIRVAQDMGHGLIVALVSALITGIMGGVLRDILCNRIPLVFHKELYASVVPAGVFVYLGMLELGVSEGITIITSLLTVFLLRVIAIYFKWSLPVFDYQEKEYTRLNRTTLFHLHRKGTSRLSYNFTSPLKKKDTGTQKKAKKNRGSRPSGPSAELQSSGPAIHVPDQDNTNSPGSSALRERGEGEGGENVD